jgi:hypothetical protein
VVSYDYQIDRNLRLKVEGYYQQLYDVPNQKIEGELLNHPESYEYQRRAMVSMLNYGANFYTPQFDSLENRGTGKNYGVELTLEKFFSENYYFLTTVSLFESKYKTPYAPERNTAFNGNFVVNTLGGYEFKIGTNNALAVDLRGVWAGGKRRLKIDLQRSIAEGEAEYDYSSVFDEKYSDYLRLDIRISFKMNKLKYSQEWALDIQNFTDNNNVYYEEFNYNRKDPQQSTVGYAYQQGLFPMMTYRITF